jgi:hypothetical protein
MNKRDKIGIYILLTIYALLAASAFTYYMLNPLVIDSVHTRELTVTQMEFTTLSDTNIIILYARNTGKFSATVTFATVKINGDTQNKITGDSIHSLTIEPGDSGIIAIEHDWITGNKYAVNLFTPDGLLVGSYTDTA